MKETTVLVPLRHVSLSHVANIDGTCSSSPPIRIHPVHAPTLWWCLIPAPRSCWRRLLASNVFSTSVGCIDDNSTLTANTHNTVTSVSDSAGYWSIRIRHPDFEDHPTESKKSAARRQIVCLVPVVVHVYHDWRFLTLEKSLLRTAAARHYYQSLGGGYFHCRHFSTATRLALHQIALCVGNPRLQASCLLFLVHNALGRGEFDFARWLLRYIKRTFCDPVHGKMGEEDVLLQRQCRAAAKLRKQMLTFVRGEVSKMKEEAPVSRASDPVASCDATVDNYARIRVFQDRSRPNEGLPIPQATLKSW